jgi:hypothetical protein
MRSAESQIQVAVPPAVRTERVDRGRGFGWLWFFLGLTCLVLAGGLVAWVLFLRPAEAMAGSLRDAVGRALSAVTGQRVTIEANTVTLEKSNISELNVVQRKTQTITKLETTLLGSKATLILRGDFLVKAGFDLTKPFSMTVNEETGEVKANFPPARITSVEMKDTEVFFADNGLIKRITPEIQQMATAQMIAQARLDAERSDLKQEAETQLAQRLRDLLGDDAKKLLIEKPQILP